MTRVLVGLIGALLLPSGCADTAGREFRVGDAEQHQIEREIAAREYRASANDTGLQAPNRAHNLRTYFSSAGIRVHDRTAQGSPELVRLALAGIGRGEEAASVPLGEEVVASGHRVEIRRPGIVEWYLNSAEGLEQGFTLAERPAGEGALVLEVAVAGAQASLHGDAVVLDTTAHRRLRYGELLAIDARGTEVPARFALSAPDRLRIVVEDAGAVYPLMIDPLLTELASHAHLERDQAGAVFGYSVASAGDVNGDGYDDVIVGARDYDAGQTDEGAAFVFLGSTAGIADAALPATQLESDQVGAHFGESVASAGDVNGDGYADVIVAASSYDVAPSFQSASFVFLGSASGIANAAAASAAAQLAGVGASAASAGDVNGDGYADVIAGGGGAFVFHGSAAGVASGSPATAATRIVPGPSNYALGGSVASAGDVNGDGYADVIVGDASYSGDVNLEGAAYIFLGSAAGVADGTPATAATRIESNSLQAFLGVSVASAGDVNGDGYADVIVGAVNMFTDGGGAALVFHGSASGIAHGTPSTASAYLGFDFPETWPGAIAASAGDVNGDGYADVIVGTPVYDGGGTGGAAFVFLGSASGLGYDTFQTADTRILSHQGSASLGSSVASAGDVNGDGFSDVVVGAPYYDSAPADEGAAFVFLGSATGIVDSGPPPLAIESVQLEGDQAIAFFGNSVASAGDVNGDGYADLIVGASFYDAGETNEGAAFVFLGSEGGIGAETPSTAAAQLESNQVAVTGEMPPVFGASVASAGDVNDDGYADVIVGAPYYDAGQSDEGAAFVFLGSPTGIADGDPATAAAQLESNQVGARFGSSVGSAGDVNGDGFDDVIAGADQYDDPGQSSEGAAFVFHGGATGIADGHPLTSATRLEGEQIQAFFGSSVASAGDVNGDGFSDVIVGAPYYDFGETGEGAAFVFLGSPTGIADAVPVTAAAQLEANQPDAAFGASVATAGDVNGDGYADVIAGAPYYGSAPIPGGGAFVFLGSASGIEDGSAATAATRLIGAQGDALLGWSVASAGDWNADGFADVIVGAPYYDGGEAYEGAALLYLGSASGIAHGGFDTAAVIFQSDIEYAEFGTSVASAGDVDGDGRAAVVVGASSAGQAGEGMARVFPEPTGSLPLASGAALLAALALRRHR